MRKNAKTIGDLVEILLKELLKEINEMDLIGIFIAIIAIVVYTGMENKIPHQGLRFWVSLFWVITIPIYFILIFLGVCEIEE